MLQVASCLKENCKFWTKIFGNKSTLHTYLQLDSLLLLYLVDEVRYPHMACVPLLLHLLQEGGISTLAIAA